MSVTPQYFDGLGEADNVTIVMPGGEVAVPYRSIEAVVWPKDGVHEGELWLNSGAQVRIPIGHAVSGFEDRSDPEERALEFFNQLYNAWNNWWTRQPEE